MRQSDKNLYGDFLVSLLNLQQSNECLLEFLDMCNKIVAVENIEDCKRLINSYSEKVDVGQIYRELPTKVERHPGRFYRNENSENAICVYWSVGVKGEYFTESEVSIPFPSAIENLIDEIKEYKRDLASFLKKMASYSYLSDMLAESYLIHLAEFYPGRKISLSENAIQYRPDYTKYWNLRSDYIENCISYAFFEFFQNNRNFNRIRLCQKCNLFFITQKIDRRIKYCSICSPKSKMTSEERRRYQRDYRKKKRLEKLAIEREARIENLMKETGYSRKEVIEIIEADQKI
jgi:hypothetical protein